MSWVAVRKLGASSEFDRCWVQMHFDTKIPWSLQGAARLEQLTERNHWRISQNFLTSKQSLNYSSVVSKVLNVHASTNKGIGAVAPRQAALWVPTGSSERGDMERYMRYSFIQLIAKFTWHVFLVETTPQALGRVRIVGLEGRRLTLTLPACREDNYCTARDLAYDSRTKLGRSIGSKVAGVYQWRTDHIGGGLLRWSLVPSLS
eukprot:4464498-Pleurochrysis_carterae.AAC.1